MSGMSSSRHAVLIGTQLGIELVADTLHCYPASACEDSNLKPPVTHCGRLATPRGDVNHVITAQSNQPVTVALAVYLSLRVDDDCCGTLVCAWLTT
jgi:hypothetical protein